MVSKRGKYFHYAVMINGVRHRGSTKETTLAKARQFEADLISEIRRRGKSPHLQKAPVLREFANSRFLPFVQREHDAGQLDGDTLLYYKNGWRLLASTEIAGMRMDQILRSHASVLSFPGGPSNANNALRTLRRILRLAAEWGMIAAAPKITTRKEKGRSALIEPWMETRLLQFAQHPLDHVLVIMQDAGMRPEEVMRLRWEQIKWERSVIEVWGKSKEPRHVPLSDRVRGRLLAIRSDNARTAVKRAKRLGKPQGQSPPWVFPSQRSRTGHLVTVQKQWEQALEDEAADAAKHQRSPLPDGLVLYCSRHTFATDLLDRTGNIAMVGKVLGHQDLRTTQKYLHPETASVTEIINERNNKNGIRSVANAV